MANDTTDETQIVPSESTEDWTAWHARIAAAQRRRDDASGVWQENVRRRRGTPTETDSGSLPLRINKDWPLTKAKMALLYSTTPQCRLTSPDPRVTPQLAAFAVQLNDTIKVSSVGSAIEEELADVINASGISGVLIACEKRTEWRDMPVVDPAMLPPEMQMAVEMGAMQIPTMPVQAVTDIGYPIRRLSPTALLIPADFTGSNYDQARWLGHEGSFTWEQAVVNLGLTEDQKDAVLGPDRRAGGSSASLNTDSTKFRDQQVVNYQELYYWRYYYHVEETSFFALQHLVFVDGLPEPVINTAYEGQTRTPDGRIIGVRRNPIQILALTYISDDCLPPSDSTISRGQVYELEDSRDAMMQQRRNSIPIRWYDTNRISPGTRSLLERGDFQGLVPISGPGDRAIGEVARAAFPPERFEFDAIINRDIQDQWQVGVNQTSGYNQSERSATEAKVIERNYQTRVSQERSKVERHFVAICEVLGALMAMHGKTALPPEALLSVVFNVRVDSTVLLDANARIDQLMRFLNMTVQSGFVNPKPVIEEIAELSGLDPTKVVVDPKPKPPEPVAISIGGPEDISNPLFLAALMRTQQAPTPEDLQAAIKLLETAMAAAPPVLPPLKMGELPQPEPLPALAPALGLDVAQGPPNVPGPEFPNWEAAARIDRRSEDGGA